MTPCPSATRSGSDPPAAFHSAPAVGPADSADDARRGRTLVLGLGNDLLADDAVGLCIVERARPLLAGRADVTGTAMHGVALLDLLLGYDRAVLVDAIHTGRRPPGTIIEIDPLSLRAAPAASPHFTGVPEMLALARQVGLAFPRRIAIIAVEAHDMTTIGGAMTPAVAAAVAPASRLVCRRVCRP